MHHHARVADGKAMTMTAEAWTVIGTGVVILLAIAASNRQLRGEMSALRGEMNALRGEMNDRMNALRGEMTDRMNGMQGEIGRLRERMARIEGLLEGLREAITGKRVA